MPRLDPLRHLAGELAALKESGLLRTPPVPEPQTYALMLTGLAVVGWVGRRRSRRCA